MSLSTPFIRRPVATTLLTIGVLVAGGIAFFQLPVAPLPQVDFPTISVRAQLPGASAEVVATSVATPLERHLGQIADVTEMTSSSTVGTTRITLQFSLDPLVQKNVTISGSFSHNGPIWERVISMIVSGQIGLDPVISCVAGLPDWHDCFEKMHRGEHVKAVLTP